MRTQLRIVGFLAFALLNVAITHAARSPLQRLPNTTLTLPASPPQFGYSLADAFPGLTFAQPVAGLPSASIEDESRSTFRIELARLIEGRFELGARYVYYTSAPTSGALEYRRQTALLYLAFLDES